MKKNVRKKGEVMKLIEIICVTFLVGSCLAGCVGVQKQEDAADTLRQQQEETKEESAQEMQQETEAVSQETEEQQTEKTMEAEEKPERIICWGDSLTYGQGGNGVTYPSVLSEKLNLEVINYGIQGETARQIGIRMGAFPMSAGAFEIPAESIPVEVSLWQWGEDPIMMRLGDCAINPCYISGVAGTLSYQAEDNKYYFTRLEEGEAKTVAEGTEIETFASKDKRKSDIVVLFAGTNLPPDKDTVGELIEREKQMLAYLEAERYVVIGLTSKTLIPDIEPINEALAEAFREHFLDIRMYLLEHGLQDAGITPTEQDKKDIEEGEIPSAIRVDEVHGNEAFYRIIGEQVLLKLEELGYITEEDKK